MAAYGQYQRYRCALAELPARAVDRTIRQFYGPPAFCVAGRSGRVPETICTRDVLPALRHLADCYTELKHSPRYLADLRELGAIWLGSMKPHPDFELVDALLAGHPLHRLERWLEQARAHGHTPKEADYYERSARRIITTWGSGVEDYSARLWSGLVRDYYAPRYRLEQGSPPLNWRRGKTAW